MDAFGFVDANQSAKGRKEVDRSGRFVLDAATRDPAFPVEDARNAMPTFKERPLLAA